MSSALLCLCLPLCLLLSPPVSLYLPLCLSASLCASLSLYYTLILHGTGAREPFAAGDECEAWDSEESMWREATVTGVIHGGYSNVEYIVEIRRTQRKITVGKESIARQRGQGRSRSRSRGRSRSDSRSWSRSRSRSRSTSRSRSRGRSQSPVQPARKTYVGEEAVNAALLLERRAAAREPGASETTGTVTMPAWKARLLARKQNKG
jgi:hypothetical protein